MAFSNLNTRLVVKAGLEIKPRISAVPSSADGLLLFVVDDTIRYANDANAEFTLQATDGPTVVASTPAAAGGAFDHTYFIPYTTTAAVTVNLPAVSGVAPGRVLSFVDTGHNAGVNNITLVADGSDKIQSTESSLTMNADGMSISLACDGTAWSIQ